MDQHHAGDASESEQLAIRLLRTLDALFHLIRYRIPHTKVEGLTIKQLHALRLLHEKPGISQKELAERLQITPAAISTAVRQLERAKLVNRQSDPKDARQMQLFLSQQAQDMLEEAHALRCGAMRTVLDALPPDEQEIIVSSLERALVATSSQRAGKTDTG